MALTSIRHINRVLNLKVLINLQQCSSLSTNTGVRTIQVIACGRIRCRFSTSSTLTQHTSRLQDDDTSYEHKTSSSSNTNGRVEDVREEVLRASLQFVPQYGWSTDAIFQGGASLGYSGMIHGMFERGEVDLINYFHHHCRGQLEQYMRQHLEEQPHWSVSSLINTAIRQRLEMNVPYIEHLSQCIGIMSLLQNAPDGVNNLLLLSDDIWHYSGDIATDWTWYSKRVSVCAVYVACELHMTQDASPHYEHTWDLLHASVLSIEDFSKYSHQIRQASIGSGVSTFLTTSLNILGLNQWRFS